MPAIKLGVRSCAPTRCTITQNYRRGMFVETVRYPRSLTKVVFGLAALWLSVLAGNTTTCRGQVVIL